MAPKRQRLQAESPGVRQGPRRAVVPPPESGPLSSFNDARQDHGLLPQIHADSASPHGNKLVDDNNTDEPPPISPVENQIPAPARSNSNHANVYASLPGITRKITACAACRKNKVSLQSLPIM